MKRKIYQQLLDWKEKRNGEVALLVEGARRIGKSYIVEEFGKNEYESYILIDFNRAPQIVRDLQQSIVLDKAGNTQICQKCSGCIGVQRRLPLHRRSLRRIPLGERRRAAVRHLVQPEGEGTDVEPFLTSEEYTICHGLFLLSPSL